MSCINLWYKDVHLFPAPRLVGIELNPGPDDTSREDQRKEIVTLHEKAGYGSRRIAKELKIDRGTVQRVLKKFKTKKTCKNLPGQGRKRKISGDLLKRVKRKAKRKKPGTKIASEISDEVSGGISERTVQRTLKDTGLQYLVIEKREELTPDQEARRLAFARKRKNHNWKYEIFVDEKTWQVGSSVNKCWQDPSHRLTEGKKRHAPKIHCWGGVGYHFKTKLHFFQENLNSDLYCKILKKRLPPEYVFNLNPKSRSKWILVQDNDPKHKSKKVTELLDKMGPDRIKDFPANSPDLNPIEDAWSIMQSEIQYKKIKTIKSLKKHLTEAWENIDIRHSLDSLSNRLRQCIKRKGKRTDY
jgi:transposase